MPGPRGARDGGYVLSPQLVELGVTTAKKERFGKCQPLSSPLPGAGEAVYLGLAPEPLQALMAVLSMFLVVQHDASSFLNLNWEIGSCLARPIRCS